MALLSLPLLNFHITVHSSPSTTSYIIHAKSIRSSKQPTVPSMFCHPSVPQNNPLFHPCFVINVLSSMLNPSVHQNNSLFHSCFVIHVLPSMFCHPCWHQYIHSSVQPTSVYCALVSFGEPLTNSATSTTSCAIFKCAVQ